MGRMYLLYDGRARQGVGGVDDATVLVVCGDEDEAISMRDDFGDVACYSYRESGNRLVDRRHEWDWPEELDIVPEALQIARSAHGGQDALGQVKQKQRR